MDGNLPEVSDTYSSDQLDKLIREIQMSVYQQHRVILTAIGVYSINTGDEKILPVYKEADMEGFIEKLEGY